MYYKKCNAANFDQTERSKNVVKFIVVHFTANNGDTARNNVDYFAREKVKASAHYFVDEKEVASSVPWYNVAWHCGGGKQTAQGGSVYGLCTNYNSIGVEMCSRKDSAGAYYFKDETISNAAVFVARLMKDYNIAIDRVVRHYDVTGKICPAPFIDERTWAAFKNLVLRKYNESEETPVEPVKYYETVEEIPAGDLRNAVKDFVSKGIIKGDGTGLHLSYDMVRVMVFCKRYMETVK